MNVLKISRRGRADLKDAISYCGWLGAFTTTSLSNRLTIQFQTSIAIRSRFVCTLKVVPDNCKCGRHNTIAQSSGGGKIVGGNEVDEHYTDD
jgi:hypothetical protein